ncbi:MAG: PEP-CTERM sorting domain-containing protein [Lentisphaeria bacterium]
MKKSLLTAGLLVAVSIAVPRAGADIIYNSVTGFSGTQGANGWSYAYKSYDVSLKDMSLATYIGAGNYYQGDLGGGRTVYLTSTGQSVIEGNAVFSIRYWTADQDYGRIRMTSSMTIGTGDYGAGIYLIDAATSTVATLATVWPKAGETQPLNAIATDIKTGDRICFMLQNAGGTPGSTSGELQAWNQTVTVPEPAALSLLALGGLVLARRRR